MRQMLRLGIYMYIYIYIYVYIERESARASANQPKRPKAPPECYNNPQTEFLSNAAVLTAKNEDVRSHTEMEQCGLPR